MEPSGKKNRPTKRTLVRWTDDLDKQVLLTIQWACADSGVKIPWNKIAKQMGANFSEGAIVQHLAKLRGKMVEHDLDVPPALKRGAVVSEPSSIYATPKGRKAARPPPPTTLKAAEPAARRPVKANGRARKRKSFDDDTEEESIPELTDSEGYQSSTKKKSAGKKGRKSVKVEAKAVEDQAAMGAGKASQFASPKFETPTVKSESIASSIEDFGGPAARTRGVRQDYTKYENDNSEVDELEEGKDVEAEKTFGAGSGTASVSGPWKDEDDGNYSPRDATNMVNSRDRFAASTAKMFDPFSTSSMTSPTARINSFPSSSMDTIYSNVGNTMYAAPPYTTPVRNNSGYIQSPHSSSFSSSRTTSMNSGMMAQQMQAMQLPSSAHYNFNNVTPGSGLYKDHNPGFDVSQNEMGDPADLGFDVNDWVNDGSSNDQYNRVQGSQFAGKFSGHLGGSAYDQYESQF